MEAGYSLDAEFDALEAFRQLIHQLLLDRAVRRYRHSHVSRDLGQARGDGRIEDEDLAGQIQLGGAELIRRQRNSRREES